MRQQEEKGPRSSVSVTIARRVLADVSSFDFSNTRQAGVHLLILDQELSVVALQIDLAFERVHMSIFELWDGTYRQMSNSKKQECRVLNYKNE